MKNIILLPTYNEKENVKFIIPEIFRIAPDIHIMVIDDNSPDGTADEIKRLMVAYPQLSIMARQSKNGLGEAYKNAMSRVREDKDVFSVITMDADGSHSPEYLLDLLKHIADYDLVIGSRYVNGGGVENWEIWRRNLSRFGNIYAKLLTGLKINDLTAGFVCIRRELLDKLDLSGINSSGYSFTIEIKYHLINAHKARVIEIPILFKSRREGESKISNQIISEGVKVPARIFLKRIWNK